MEIIRDEQYLKNFPLVSEFYQSYHDLPQKLINCIALTQVDNDEPENPETTGLILFRTVIEKNFKPQKFILTLRFLNFGDMAIVDLVSRDLENHRDIAFDHLNRLNWVPWTGYNVTGDKKVDKFRQSYSFPVMLAGGYCELDDEGRIKFAGASEDYGGKLFGYYVCDLARYVAETCGIKIENNDTEMAQNFFVRLLYFMQKYKKSPKFYELLVEKNLDAVLTGQQISGLVVMKAIDRTLSENKKFIEIVVDEITNSHGLAKTYMLLKAAHKFSIE